MGSCDRTCCSRKDSFQKTFMGMAPFLQVLGQSKWKFPIFDRAERKTGNDGSAWLELIADGGGG